MISFYFVDLWYACSKGALDIVRILIREGQNPNEQTFVYRNTPLHIAARAGHYLIVKYLLDIGGNTTILNSDQMTPK